MMKHACFFTILCLMYATHAMEPLRPITVELVAVGAIVAHHSNGLCLRQDDSGLLVACKTNDPRILQFIDTGTRFIAAGFNIAGSVFWVSHMCQSGGCQLDFYDASTIQLFKTLAGYDKAEFPNGDHEAMISRRLNACVHQIEWLKLSR